jgi:hypothetical protein
MINNRNYNSRIHSIKHKINRLYKQQTDQEVIGNKVSTDMVKHFVMTGQLREMLKYFQNPAAEN